MTGAEIDRRLSELETEMSNLTAAIAAGKPLKSVLDALQAREAEQTHLLQRRRDLARASAVSAVDEVLALLKGSIESWRVMLHKNVPQARQLIRKVVKGRIS